MLQPINGAKTKVSNQRIVLAAGLITPQLVINTIRKALPAAG
jgi:tRNA U34 5-methylaminomethyl-2-thiouridine-forming methyltransferase MnmC